MFFDKCILKYATASFGIFRMWSSWYLIDHLSRCICVFKVIGLDNYLHKYDDDDKNTNYIIKSTIFVCSEWRVKNKENMFKNDIGKQEQQIKVTKNRQFFIKVFLVAFYLITRQSTGLGKIKKTCYKIIKVNNSNILRPHKIFKYVVSFYSKHPILVCVNPP